MCREIRRGDPSTKDFVDPDDRYLPPSLTDSEDEHEEICRQWSVNILTQEGQLTSMVPYLARARRLLACMGPNHT
jgi:hypothetical protein